MSVDPFQPVHVLVDALHGSIADRTGAKENRIRDLFPCFVDEAAFAALVAKRGNDLAYAVHEVRPARSETQDLIFGTSTLQPGKVGREFFMTRGHIHARVDRPELYYCLRGHGVMHLEAPDGQTDPRSLEPGTVVYVTPRWIHRSVNVGDEPLTTLFCYPADAGQDYDIIARANGMRTLIVDDGAGGWTEIENPRYRPRSAEEVRRYLEG